MSSYRQIYYHIIFRTKNSEQTLPVENNKQLFAYIMGIVNNKNCHLYRINGMSDHIHLLIELHPNVSLADFMRDLKTSTSIWLKKNHNFPLFKGWADGYAALTKSYHDKDQVIHYIKNQQQHHKKESFTNEFKRLLLEEGIKIDEKYFLK
jgi:REP element-mobilizing transposase RayT